MMRVPLNLAGKVADWFLLRVDRASGDTITHLKLQKLVYYAQAWSLANFNKPLFAEDVQAWTHGPVTPSLWDRYRNNQWAPLDRPHIAPDLNREQDAVLAPVWDTYGKYEAKFLEDLTHQEDPWKLTRGDIPLQARCTKPIGKRLMRDYYAKKINKKWPATILAG